MSNFVIVAVLISTLAIAMLASTKSMPESVNTSAIYNGNTEGNSVSLMFNVYQNTAEVIEIARILDEYDFSATFFVGGSWVNKNGDALIRIATNGNEVGNHGYIHRDHAKLSVSDNKKEITLTQTIIDGTLAGINDSQNPFYSSLKLFAPPSGSLGTNMFTACDELGYKVIMWTRDTIDWRDQNSDLIYERAVRDIKAGDLILMHPTPKTVEALPKVLDHILRMGLKADIVSNTISADNN